MFKKHALQIKMVNTKDAETGADATPVKTVDPAEIAKIATEYTVKTVAAVGAVIAANKVLTSICEIGVIVAKAKIK